tara:strand:- start:45 stop:449 length:405 start_codon:yes stop_codon:yes gene_type:complete
MVNKLYIDWRELELLVDNLCKQIQERLFYTDDVYTSIHGLSRGGLIPAVMVSHKLDIPYTEDPTDETLIIDDICDSGKTLQTWKGYTTAVLHYKPHTSCYEPTIYSEKHTSDDWIIYPWEMKDSKTIQDYKLDK